MLDAISVNFSFQKTTGNYHLTTTAIVTEQLVKVTSTARQRPYYLLWKSYI